MFHPCRLKKAVTSETDLSAQQSSPEADSWFPRAHALEPGARGSLAAAPEGTQAPERLMAPAKASPPSHQSGSPSNERLSPDERVRRRADYLRCYRTGRRRQGPLALLYFLPNHLGHPRIGITASRKVGNAVVRHRLKRRLIEIYRRWGGRASLPAVDMVVHLKVEARTSDFDSYRAEIVRLLSGLRERREGRP